jgi:cell shape-determining protein MreC
MPVELSCTSFPGEFCSGLVNALNSHPSLNELINDFRELQAEVERLRALREDYERQMKMGVPRRLLHPDRTDLSDKDHEIEILKEQLKQTEEQLRQSKELAKAQK